MKKLVFFTVLFTGCTTSPYSYNRAEFDWMPDPIKWENNIRDCRSQPQCNAADLFNRF